MVHLVGLDLSNMLGHMRSGGLVSLTLSSYMSIFGSMQQLINMHQLDIDSNALSLN